MRRGLYGNEYTELTNLLEEAINDIVMSGGNENVLNIMFSKVPDLSGIRGPIYRKVVWNNRTQIGTPYKRRDLIRNTEN
jgi:hypothetical protein